MWPFSRYPQFDRGENLFRRNAFKSILVARYVGAIRPFVPAIAGMMKMPASRYMQASGIASISWAVLFLAPAGCSARPMTRWPPSQGDWWWWSACWQ